MQKRSEKQKKPKKPKFIKKSDLDIEGYKKELRDRDPKHLFRTTVNNILASRQFWTYVAIQLVAGWYGYGQVALCTGKIP